MLRKHFGNFRIGEKRHAYVDANGSKRRTSWSRPRTWWSPQSRHVSASPRRRASPRSPECARHPSSALNSARKVSAEGGQVSDRTRQLRDEEQQHLCDEALRGAITLISDHRSKLDQLAGALLRNEVLERKDIDRIMEGVPRFHRSPGQGLRVVAAARTDVARH